MQFASNTRRKQNRRSSAAQKAVSPKQVRRRKQAQKRRRFNAAIRSAESLLQKGGQLMPAISWGRMWQPLRAPALPGFSGLIPSKILSFMLLSIVVAGLYWMQTNDSFFVYQEDVSFVGAGYLSDEELYAVCDVESWSILWLEPALIQEQVTRHPYVAAAQVTIRWPAQVEIHVDEVHPVALWATDQQEYWVLANGTALAPRSSDDSPNLRILDPSGDARAENVDGGQQIDTRILATALSLRSRLSGVNEFWYNSGYGLNFSLPTTRAWVYWGDGRKFEEKWSALQASIPELEAERDEDLTLNVTAPNRPFIRRYAPSQSN